MEKMLTIVTEMSNTIARHLVANLWGDILNFKCKKVKYEIPKRFVNQNKHLTHEEWQFHFKN